MERGAANHDDGGVGRRDAGHAPEVAPAWPLVGRKDELAVAARFIDRLRGGSGGYLIITGDAGAGKTFLADEVARRARGVVTVRRSSALPGIVAPFGLVREAFASASAPPVEQPDSSGAAPTFFEAGISNLADALAIEDLLERAEAGAGDGSVLVVLDDVHLADRGSVALLSALAPRLESLPLGLILTSRPPDGSTPFGAAWSTIAEGAIVCELEPLTEVELEELCVVRFNAPPGPHLRSLFGATSGSPLWATAILESIQPDEMAIVDGCCDVHPSTAGQLRESASSAVRSHLSGVVGADTKVAATAAIAGQRIDVADVAAVLGEPLVQVSETFERLERHGVLVVSSTHYRFRHEQYRQAASQLVSAPIRAALHRSFADLFADQGGSALTIADHLIASGATGTVAAARLVDAARELVAHDPAAALALTEAASDMSEIASRALSMVRVRALAGVGRVAESEALVGMLLRDADPDEEVTLHRERAVGMFQQGRAGEAVIEIQRAEDLATDDRLQGRLVAERAFMHLLAAEFASARSAAERGAEAGRVHGDVTTVLGAEMVGCLVALYDLDLDRAEDIADRLVRLSDLPESADATIYQPWFAASLLHLELGNFDTAREINVVGRTRSSRVGYTWMLPAYDALDAYVALAEGNLDDAEAAALASLAAGIDDSFGASLWCHSFLARSAAARGNWEVVDERIRRAEQVVRVGQAQLGVDHLAIAQASALVHRDRIDEARDVLADTWYGMEAFQIRAPRQEVAVELARLAARCGDEEQCAELLSDLERSAVIAHRPRWSVDHAYVRALVDSDVDGIVEASDRYLSLGRRLVSARARADASLLASGRVAAALASQAHVELQGLGAFGEAAAVSHLLDRSTVQLAADGPMHLSRSEQVVVDLVAEGLSNPQIAQRLFVSRRTVESHVSSAYRKLGVSNRVELARCVLATD